MSEMFRIDQVHVRLSEVASVRIDAGNTYAKLIVRMKDGKKFVDAGQRSYETERALLEAIERQAIEAIERQATEARECATDTGGRDFTLPRDVTYRGDVVAYRMRVFYEANKPLRWWQRRRVWNDSRVDDLMLGLLNVVLQARWEEIDSGTLPRDLTARRDAIAGQMRVFYEANRPLRWWQRRNRWGEWLIADDLMLGLLNVVLQARWEQYES
jgi:hypothetical protein